MFDNNLFDNSLMGSCIEIVDDLTSFNMRWTFAVVVLIVCALVLYRFVRKWKGWPSILKLVEDKLAICALVVFLCGLSLYCIAYWEDYDVGNFIVVVPKAAVSAMSMFVSGSGLIEVKSSMKDSIIFMTLLTSVHVFSVFISAMVILKVLGYKVESYINLKLRKATGRTLVFWGVNENSLMLAESITDRTDTTVIFVDMPAEDGSDNSNPLLGVLDDRSVSRDDIYRMDNMGAFLLRAKCGFNDLNTRGGAARNEDVYSLMGIKMLRKFVRDGKKVNFYFLSDNEQENLDSLMAIVKFFGPDKIDDLSLSRIYCHARGNSLNNIIDRLSDKICFVDSSKLSILQLQNDVRYQPAAFVDVDTGKGVVTSAFNALVIGFGETGRDAFQFLYEFSSFLGGEGGPSRRTINVVDAMLSEKKTRFILNSPALNGRKDIDWWEDMSIDSEDFWNRYRIMIDSLNYLVITLNDDKMASDLAVKLYETAYRYRADMRKFKIFVRINDTEASDKLQQATNYYMSKSNREDRGTETIVPFGTSKSLFNISIFDTEVIDAAASKFSDQYYELYKAISEKLSSPGAPSPKDAAKDVKKYADRQQDISNVRHVHTKLILAGAYASDWTIDGKRLEYLREISHREGDTYPNAQPSAPDAFALMENLSLCEHLRWNAKMELLGFLPRPYNPAIPYPERDYDARNHECLVSCQELNDKKKFRATKIYDWAVVELSFRYGG